MSENCQHLADGYTILMDMNATAPPTQADEHARRYAAVQSRDERFDGLFFTGVTTTGIFCRPVCPAKTPRAENVRFFSTAAAASSAGFRPCLRCRPEAAPDSPEWNWPSTVVSRAVRLIADGALEEQNLDDLAARLHLSARQLRRYFVNELGVPPVKVAQTQRLLFAKQLITETALPMTEIAFAAGYGSLRRFNDALSKTYKRPPTALRRDYKQGEREEAAPATSIALKLGYRPPYDWPAVLAARCRWALPGVEAVGADNVYRRAVCFGKQMGVIAVQPVELITPSAHHLLLHVPMNLAPHLRPIVARIKRMFDLRADPAAIGEHLAQNVGLSEFLAVRRGVRLPSAWDAREAAVQLVLKQAVGAARASEILRQIVVDHGVAVNETGEDETGAGRAVGRLRAVPLREEFARALLDFDLPSTTIATLRKLTRDDPHAAPSIEETVAQLRATTDHTLDAATAHAVALHGLGEPDALPTNDAALVEQAAAWRPWRSYGWLLVNNVG